MNSRTDQLLNKDDYRKWLICKAIDQGKEVNIQYLVKLCACTSKTVLSDIQEINDQYSTINNMPILKKKNSLIYIDFNQSIPLNTIYRKNMVESLSFKLLNEIIKNNEITLGEFSRRNYISYNPIYRAIAKLNTYLALFQLTIKKFKLTGEEYKIRIFLFHFYWTIFGGGPWPFLSVNKQECKEEADKLEYAFFTHLTWIEYEKLCFWLAIFIIRERVIHEDSATKIPIYWQNLREEKYKNIKKVYGELSLKQIGDGHSFIFVAVFLVCGIMKLKDIRLGLVSFIDSFSVASQSLMMRLKENGQKNIKDTSQTAQNELIKFIHYNQLGEAYIGLALKIEEESWNFIDRNSFPELISIPTKQASQIVQILQLQNLLVAPYYSIYIATKHGDSTMRKIKALLEAQSPENFHYFSLWTKTEKANVILTDIEQLPEITESFQLQFFYPFNEKKARELVKKLKAYFNLKGDIS